MRLSRLAAVLVVLVGVLALPAAHAADRPANDDIADATVIGAVPFTDSISTVGATSEPGEPESWCSVGTNSVWYRFTPDATSLVQIDTFGSDFDTVLSVWVHRGPHFGLEHVACNDESGSGSQSEIHVTLEAGGTYYFQVTGWDGAEGNLVLNLDAPRPPANDAFADAMPIGGTPYSAHHPTRLATTEAGEPDRCGAAATVWFSFAPGEGDWVIDTFGSWFDTVVAVYTGDSVDELTQVACNDDVSWRDESLLPLHTDAGETYWIQVGGFLGETGRLTLTIEPGEWTQQSVTLLGRFEGGSRGDRHGACVTSRFVPSECVFTP